MSKEEKIKRIYNKLFCNKNSKIVDDMEIDILNHLKHYNVSDICISDIIVEETTISLTDNDIYEYENNIGILDIFSSCSEIPF